jgi:hypothetical protein
MTDEELQRVSLQFQEVVNLSDLELEAWLGTDESKAVGFKPEGSGESVGHASGRRIVRLLRMRGEALDEDDYRHMRKVVGYVHRHLAQRPRGDLTHTRWRYSLMNWGHDPLRDDEQAPRLEKASKRFSRQTQVDQLLEVVDRLDRGRRDDEVSAEQTA